MREMIDGVRSGRRRRRRAGGDRDRGGAGVLRRRRSVGGGETFASGGSDIADVARRAHATAAAWSTLRIFECTKPVIGAINGAAVGVGVTMTLPMDIRLASTSARFGFVFARRGIVPEAASSWFLPRVVGISQAAEWCFTGRVFGAQEALAGGLVRSVHAPDELLPAATGARRRDRRQHRAGLGRADPPDDVADARRRHPMEAHRVDSRAIQSAGAAPTPARASTSFLEKRPAAFPVRVSDGLPDVFPGWDTGVRVKQRATNLISCHGTAAIRRCRGNRYNSMSIR